MAAHLCTPCVVCGQTTGEFMCPEDRPSPIFSTFAVILNSVYGIWTLVVVIIGDCGSAQRTWAVLGMLTALVNFGFAFYLYFRFAAKVRDEGQTAGKAACSLFMYDWGVCMYMLFLVWIIVWMVLAGNYEEDADSDDACANVLTAGIVFFILYFVVGAFMIALSLFTECCREPSWKRGARAGGAANHTPTPQPQQRQTGGFFSSLFGPSRQQQQPAQPTPPQPMYATAQPQVFTPQQSAYPPPAPQQQAGAPPPRNPNYQA